MTENLPAVPSSGAVIVQPAGAVQIDAAAAGSSLGEALLERAAPTLGSQPHQILAAATKEATSLVWRALDLAKPNQQQLEGIEEVSGRYRPLYVEALQAGDTERIVQLGSQFERDLIIAGGLDREQIEKIRPLFQASDRYFEQVFRSLPRKALAPTSLPAIENRKAAIEKLMGDESSEYWKGPRAEALQAEYRDLIDRRTGVSLSAAICVALG